MGLETKVGITVEATDKGSAVVAQAAEKIRNTSVEANGLGQSVKRLPEMLSKSQMAIMVMSNEASKMGGSVAMVTSKIAGVASMMAMGGPLGVALAGTTAAAMAVTVAYSAMTAESRMAEAGQRSLADAMRALNEYTRSQQAEVDKLTKTLADWGKQSTQIAVDDMRQLISAREDATKKLRTDAERERAAYQSLSAELDVLDKKYGRRAGNSAVTTRQAEIIKELELKKQEVEAAEQALDIADKAQARDRQRLQMLEEIRARAQEDEAAEKKKHETEKTRDDARHRRQQQLLDDQRAAADAWNAIFEQHQEQVDAMAKADEDAAKERERIEKEERKKRMRTLQEAIDEKIKAEEAAAAQLRTSFESIGQQFGADITRPLQAAIEGTLQWGDLGRTILKNLEQTTLDTMLQMLVQKGIASIGDWLFGLQGVSTAAALASANAFASTAAIPVIGPAAAPAAAATAYGTVMAMEALVPPPVAMASGGRVPMSPGAIAGRDSVHALLTPDEHVLSVAEARAYRAGSGRGSVNHYHLSAPLQTVGMPTQAETDRWLRERVIPGLERLERAGMYRRGR